MTTRAMIAAFIFQIAVFCVHGHAETYTFKPGGVSSTPQGSRLAQLKRQRYNSQIAPSFRPNSAVGADLYSSLETYTPPSTGHLTPAPLARPNLSTSLPPWLTHEKVHRSAPATGTQTQFFRFQLDQPGYFINQRKFANWNYLNSWNGRGYINHGPFVFRIF